LIAAIAVIAVIAVATASFVAFQVLKPHPTSEPTPSAQPVSPSQQTSLPTTSSGPPPVAETALDGLMLSPDQISTALGTTGLVIAGTQTGLYNNDSAVAEKACLPLSTVVEATSYASSGWTASHGQKLYDPGNVHPHIVDQFVVLFSSAREAAAFFNRSAQSWAACSNLHYTFAKAGQHDQVWNVGPISNTDGTLSATKTEIPFSVGNIRYEGNCQRALTVANNVAIDVEACESGVGAAAVTIARKIAAKVPAA
jgi:serine/threonine-protein kinase